MSRVSHRYDVVFIGGGHNGLAAAARLAGAGLRVLVLERRDQVGGAAVTEEIFPGFRVSTAAYLVSLLRQKVVDELDLASFGYQVDPKDPAFFSLFPDGRALTMWQDEAKTLVELARFSEHDAKAYASYGRFVSRLAGVVEAMLLSTPPNVPPRSAGDLIEALRLAGRLRGLDRRHISGLLKIMTQSAGEFLDEWFESDEIKATLATDGVIGANGGPLSPGTAYVLLHHVMGGVGGVPGLWGFVRGGMGALTGAMAGAARARGAEIRCGADVRRIIVRNGRARGVALASGDEYEARAVVSNADPKRTFLGLLARDDLDPEFRAGIERYRSEGTSLKINLALDGLPEFRAAPGAGPHLGATMHICPSIEYMERAWDDAKYGRPSRNPIIEMTIPTIYDPSLAPPGKHVMGVFLQYAPYSLADGGWDDIRESYADHVIDLIARYAPNLPSIILDRQVLTPLDLERVYGLTGGNIFHGAMSLDQLFVARPLLGWAQYRTPVKNLYLCGAGAHPGGGVMAAAGWNAAGEILRDFRK